MTAKLFISAKVTEPRVEPASDGVRILLGTFFGDDWWITVTSRADCAALMKVITDADTLFVVRQLGRESHAAIEAQLAPTDAAGPPDAGLAPSPRDGSASPPGGPAALHDSSGPAMVPGEMPGRRFSESAHETAGPEDLEPLPVRRMIPDPAPRDEPTCDAADGNWVCGALPGHGGDHAAFKHGVPEHVWEQE